VVIVERLNEIYVDLLVVCLIPSSDVDHAFSFLSHLSGMKEREDVDVWLFECIIGRSDG
jgi:hypothetical protein